MRAANTMPESNVSEASETRPAEIVTEVPVPAPGGSVRVSFHGISVAVFNSGGKLYALEAECGHRKGPLDQGRVVGGAVVCPWHGVRFNLESGEVDGGNFFVRRSSRPVRAFVVQAIEGRIALRERGNPVGPSSAPIGSTIVATTVGRPEGSG